MLRILHISSTFDYILLTIYLSMVVTLGVNMYFLISDILDPYLDKLIRLFKKKNG